MRCIYVLSNVGSVGNLTAKKVVFSIHLKGNHLLSMQMTFILPNDFFADVIILLIPRQTQASFLRPSIAQRAV